MKKHFLSLLLLFALVLTLTGCGDEKTSFNTNGKKQSNFNMNETAVYKDIHYTVTNTEYYSDNNSNGSTYLKISIKVENKSDSVANYPIIDLRLKTSDGNLIKKEIKFKNDLDDYSVTSLSPNGVITGIIRFEVSTEEKNLQLVYLDYDKEVFSINLK